MATFNEYTGNGSTVLFSFTFPYISDDDVKVSVDGVIKSPTTEYIFANATTIQFITPPPNQSAVRIFRRTPSDDVETTFFPGSAIRAADLNSNFVQTLYVVQEATLDASDAIILSNQAVNTANSAETKADQAVSTANTANATSAAAESTANQANANSSAAQSAAATASADAAAAVAAAQAAQSINDSFTPNYQTPGDSQTPVVSVSNKVPIIAEKGVQLPFEGVSTYEENGAIRFNDTLDKIELYNGSEWVTAAGGASVSSSPPVPASEGDVWYDPDTGRAYVYYTDSDSSQWVEMNPSWNGSVADGSVTPAKLSTGGPYWDSSGNVGIGSTAPGGALDVVAGNTSNYAIIANNSNSSGDQNFLQFKASSTVIGDFNRPNGTNDVEFNAGYGAIAFGTDTAGTPSERARIDSSGRLLVGTSSSPSAGQGQYARIVAQGYVGSDNNVGIIALQRGETAAAMSADDWVGRIAFNDSTGETFAKIECGVDGTPGSSDYPGRLVFSTTADGASSPTERMRIGADGHTYWGAANPGTSAFGTSIGRLGSPGFFQTSRNVNGTSEVGFFNGNAGEVRIYGNGNIQNTNNSYTGISDIKLKENIVDANSQWDDIKTLQVRNYNFKPETGYNNQTQIGLIAQEVELVSPGLVTETPDRDEDGSDLGTVTKSVNYSVLYMKAVKALQEAMERIEALEASNAALEARLTTLEGGNP